MKKPVFKKLTQHHDRRGRVIEILRTEDVRNQRFGQITLSTAVPGETKGKHYHKRKTEWYCVVRGNAELTLRNNTTMVEERVRLSGEEVQLIEIPPQWYHEITNTGKEELFLLVYCDESFDKKDQDTFYEK